ncbi:MAG: hypothetical protein MJY92_03820 [Bacteroidales bacterium]|nr:hypothetical protein [Bacteroidales bacterium]
MKYLISILLFLSCLSLSARERVFTISKGKESSRMTVHESQENGLYTYTFDYGDSKTTKTVDSNYHSISWDIDAPAQETKLSVTIKDDGYHMDGIYKGKEIHKVMKKDGNSVWMQGIGYCGGHFLKAGDSFEYTNISLHDLKLYDMRAVYVGEETRDGMKVYHFCMSPTGGFAKFFKAHYYYDTQTGDLVAQHAHEGLPGTPETVWTLAQ